MDVIYDFYYIHDPMESRINQVIFAVLDVSRTMGCNGDKTSKVFVVLIQLKTDAIHTASRLAVYIIVKQSKIGQPCARLAMSIDTYKLFL